MYGPAFQDFVVEHPEHSPHYEYQLCTTPTTRARRRSVYRFLVRSQPQPFMTALDCADPSMQVDRRNETLSPLQALALLQQRVHAGDGEAPGRARRDGRGPPSEQVAAAFRLAIGRAPTADERAALAAYARRARPGERLPGDPEPERIRVRRLTRPNVIASPLMNRRDFLWHSRRRAWAASRLTAPARGPTAASAASHGRPPARPRPDGGLHHAPEGEARRAAVHGRRRQPHRPVRLQAGTGQAARPDRPTSASRSRRSRTASAPGSGRSSTSSRTARCGKMLGEVGRAARRGRRRDRVRPQRRRQDGRPQPGHAAPDDRLQPPRLPRRWAAGSATAWAA